MADSSKTRAGAKPVTGQYFKPGTSPGAKAAAAKAVEAKKGVTARSVAKYGKKPSKAAVEKTYQKYHAPKAKPIKSAKPGIGTAPGRGTGPVAPSGTPIGNLGVVATPKGIDDITPVSNREPKGIPLINGEPTLKPSGSMPHEGGPTGSLTATPATPNNGRRRGQGPYAPGRRLGQLGLAPGRQRPPGTRKWNNRPGQWKAGTPPTGPRHQPTGDPRVYHQGSAATPPSTVPAATGTAPRRTKQEGVSARVRAGTLGPRAQTIRKAPQS